MAYGNYLLPTLRFIGDGLVTVRYKEMYVGEECFTYKLLYFFFIDNKISNCKSC